MRIKNKILAKKRYEMKVHDSTHYRKGSLGESNKPFRKEIPNSFPKSIDNGRSPASYIMLIAGLVLSELD